MDKYDQQIYENTSNLNASLIEQNELYRKRIDILEEHIHYLKNPHDAKDSFFEKLKRMNDLENLESAEKTSDSESVNKDTSMRISQKTKDELEQVQYDMTEQNRENLSYSEVIELLIENYKSKRS